MKNKTLIANLRKQQGLTQEGLAEKCGLSIRTIQRLESGEDANVTTLSLIAQALNVSIGDLFASIADSGKEQEISNYTELKNAQVNQRKGIKKLYDIVELIFILVMLGLMPIFHSGFAFLIWAFMWPIGFTAFKTLQSTWINPMLDKKYPLTKGINLKKYKSSDD